jgi:hypothetical protein
MANNVITIVHKGDFKKTNQYLFKMSKFEINNVLNKYGKLGVEALKAATPLDTGKTSDSWYYDVKHTFRGYEINWYNSNINKGVPIAVILQYGHGTGGGGYVKGTDYINPAMKDIFEDLADEAWKELTSYAG